MTKSLWRTLNAKSDNALGLWIHCDFFFLQQTQDVTWYSWPSLCFNCTIICDNAGRVLAEHQGLASNRLPLSERSYLATDLEWAAIDKAPINEASPLIQSEWSREEGNIDPLMAISTVRLQKCQIEMSTCHFSRRFDTKNENSVRGNSVCQWIGMESVKVSVCRNFPSFFLRSCHFNCAQF